MIFPDCPDARTDCRFTDAGSSSTAMSSPLSFDRNGYPAGGGANTIAQQIKCTTCGRSWQCSQTELAWAQGVAAQWEVMG